MAKVSFEGASAGTASLDLKTASPDVAKGLVHKYVVMVRQNARRGTASTLTKSEVRGGGRKPFKQKGTGNARAGSTRTPLKPGGGVIFGPKPKDWSIKMNKKERRLAMATAIQSASSAMIVVDDLAKCATPKTKAMGEALKSWGVAEGEKAYLITKDASDNVTLDFVKKAMLGVMKAFPDFIFHQGGDETIPQGGCTWDDIHTFEKEIQNFVNANNRAPMAWNEVFSKPVAGTEPNAALPGTIIQVGSSLHDAHGAGVTNSHAYALCFRTGKAPVPVPLHRRASQA